MDANKKLPNRHPEITKITATYALSGKDFPLHFEKLLQEVFSLIAIVPSLELGLISPDSLTVNGDGTCVHYHCDPLGVKVCECRENGIFN